MPIRLKIVGIQDDTDRIRVFDLDAPDGVTLPTYTAGAHLTFDLTDCISLTLSYFYRCNMSEEVQQQDGQGVAGQEVGVQQVETVGEDGTAMVPATDRGMELHAGDGQQLGFPGIYFTICKAIKRACIS